MKYPRYRNYKDSGVEWLGYVPEGWDIKRLKSVCSLVGGGTPSKDNLSYWMNGTVLWVSPKDMTCKTILSAEDTITEQAVLESATNVIAKGMPLIVARSGILKHTLPVAVAGCRLTINQDLKAFCFTEHILPYYFAYWIEGNSDALLPEWRQVGATVESIDIPQMMNSCIAIPPLCEQQIITTYLDVKTGVIDTLITEQEKLITLLKEKRQAVISHAVTKGLNPDAPMKDSGVEWLGMVPEGWVVKRLRYLCELNPRKSEVGIDASQNVSFIPMEAVGTEGEQLVSTQRKLEEVYSGYTYFREQDILIAKITPCFENGKGVCARNLINGVGFGSTEFHVLGTHGGLLPQFLYYITVSTEFRKLGEAAMTGATGQKRVPEEFLKNYLCVIPPVKEQQEIVNYIQLMTEKLDVLRTECVKQIDLLLERRQTLISAAVTGKIDVRNFAKSVATATQPVATKSLNYFRRTVFAAEIVEQMCDKQEFGHVMFQKCLYVAQYHLQIDGFAENYYRQTAGPYDGTLLRSVEGQMAKGRWFQTIRRGKKYYYKRLEKCGKFKQYFDNYFGTVADELSRVLGLFRKMTTDQVEIVATLYAVWNDFLIKNEMFDDTKIITEVLTNWDDSKKRFSQERWQTALNWMRDEGLVPTGFGQATKISHKKRKS